MTSGLHQVEDQFSTDANAVLNTVQQLAGALGTSIVATIVAEHQSTVHQIAFGTMTGVRTAFCLLFILQLIALLFTFLVTQKLSVKK